MLLHRYILAILLWARVLHGFGFQYGTNEVNSTSLPPPQSEVQALWALFNATSGSQWTWDGNQWDFSSSPSPNPCSESWQGIFCRTLCIAQSCQEHIEEIALVGVGLNGVLPDTFDDFQYLTNLTIRGNSLLSGAIPSTICETSNISALNLGSNALNASIPWCIGNLTRLITIDLSDNLLSHDIPSSISNLTMLETLNLASNHLSGELSSFVGGLTNLKSLNLRTNSIRGTIPAALGQLVDLITLDLGANYLSSAIPAEIGKLRKLQDLYLDYNRLHGSIPDEIGELSSLVRLVASSNSLNGSLPSSLGNLSSLIYLQLWNNRISGCIPNSMGNLVALREVDLGFNRLTGAIPQSIGNLSALSSLRLSYNTINESLPSSIGELDELWVLEIHDNHLHGTIPDSIGGLSRLGYLYLSNNFLHGDIPASLVEMSFLQYLDLSSNHLVGTIPNNTFSRMPSLHRVNLEDNLLHGELPDDLTVASALEQIVFSKNLLQDELPEDWHQMTQLFELQVAKNMMYGFLPPALLSLSSLSQLNTASNLFSGKIPPCQGPHSALHMVRFEENLFSGSIDIFPPDTTSLTLLNASSNLLSGTVSSLNTIPAVNFLDLSWNVLSGSLPSISNLKDLQLLFLQYNHFEGQMTSFFDTVLPLLSYVELSNNHLSGELPRHIAGLPRLNSFVAVENCLESPLPMSLCQLPALEILGLDGLSTSKQCRITSWPGVLQTYYLAAGAVHGTIPQCIFALPRLQTLHLAGNFLSGSLPNDLVLTPTLTRLSLSHNRLTGSIPGAFHGGKQWIALDLSFNKFTGHLLSSAESFSDFAAITMDENRLSGDIPRSYFSVEDVSILRGNMFRCGGRGLVNDLPTGDAYRQEYDCGSDSLNSAFVIWAICVVVVVVVVAAALSRVWGSKQRWALVADSEPADQQDDLLPRDPSSLFSRDGAERPYDAFAMALIAWFSAFRTRQHLETWFHHDHHHNCISATFLPSIFDAMTFLKHLRTAGAVLSIVLVVVVSPIYIALSLYYGSYEDEFAWTNSAAYLSGLVAALILLLLFLFVLALLRGLGTTFPCLARNVAAEMYFPVLPSSPYRLRAMWLSLGNITIVLLVNGAFVYIYSQLDRVQSVILAMLLSLFKLLWSVVVRHVIIAYLQPPAADGDPSSLVLHLSNVYFFSALMIFNTIVAPCFAAFFAHSSCFYYVFFRPPLIVSTYDFLRCEEFTSDSCSLFVSTEQDVVFQPPFAYSYQCSSGLLVDYGYVFAYKYIFLGVLFPAIVLAISRYLHYKALVAGSVLSVGDRLLMLGIPLVWKTDLLAHCTPLQDKPSLLSQWIQSMEQGSLQIAPFSAGDYAVRMAMMIAAMLTFGVVLPPLGLLIFVAICTNTATTQAAVGRWLWRLSGQETTQRQLSSMERQCSELFLAWRLAVKPLGVLVVCFYAVFVFDTEGDSDGAWLGLWLALPILVAPPLLLGMNALWDGRKLLSQGRQQ